MLIDQNIILLTNTKVYFESNYLKVILLSVIIYHLFSLYYLKLLLQIIGFYRYFNLKFF